MAWCPVCKTEYREGFTFCSDCNSPLVEELEENNGKEKGAVYDHEVYLTTARDEIEAEVLEALLKSSDIPVLRKYRDAGGYLSICMGNTITGIDIYVPSKLHEAAKGLIETKEDVGSYEKDIQSNEKNNLVLFIPMVFIAAVALIAILWRIFFR